MDLIRSLENIKAKKQAEAERKDGIQKKYKEKNKTKPLTQGERLDRIEELLGLK